MQYMEYSTDGLICLTVIYNKLNICNFRTKFDSLKMSIDLYGLKTEGYKNNSVSCISCVVG